MTSSDAYRTHERSPYRPQAVTAPNSHEGVGNALRSAYAQVSSSIPDEWTRLLNKLDR